MTHWFLSPGNIPETAERFLNTVPVIEDGEAGPVLASRFKK